MSIITDYTTVKVDDLVQSPALSFAVALCRKLDMALKDDTIFVDGEDIEVEWDACDPYVAWETLEQEWIDPRFNICEENKGKVSFAGISVQGKLYKASGPTKAEAMNKAMVKSMAGEKIDIPTFLIDE